MSKSISNKILMHKKVLYLDAESKDVSNKLMKLETQWFSQISAKKLEKYSI